MHQQGAVLAACDQVPNLISTKFWNSGPDTPKPNLKPAQMHNLGLQGISGIVHTLFQCGCPLFGGFYTTHPGLSQLTMVVKNAFTWDKLSKELTMVKHSSHSCLPNGNEILFLNKERF